MTGETVFLTVGSGGSVQGGKKNSDMRNFADDGKD